MRYHFLIENTTRAFKDAVLLGNYDNLLAYNFGSDLGILIKLLNNRDKTYTELLHESANIVHKTEILRFITDSWEKMPKELNYKRQDANGSGEDKDISLVTNKWGRIEMQNKAINDVRISKTIDGSSTFRIKIYPKSELELIIIEQQ